MNDNIINIFNKYITRNMHKDSYKFLNKIKRQLYNCLN